VRKVRRPKYWQAWGFLFFAGTIHSKPLTTATKLRRQQRRLIMFLASLRAQASVFDPILE